MEFTNERVIPDNYHSLRSLYYWHLARYDFAKRFLQRNDRVLDIACGSGYGSYEMAFIAKDVTAIDVDEETIDYARHKFSSPNIEYICGNAIEIEEITNGKFDICTSFETIEHLTQGDQNVFLKNVVNILDERGAFLVSTPNTKIYSGGRETTNKYHLHELDFQEFKELLERYFEIVFIVGQRRFEGAVSKDRVLRVSNALNALKTLSLKKVRKEFYSYDSCQQIGDFEFPSTDFEDCLMFIAICRRPKIIV